MKTWRWIFILALVAGAWLWSAPVQAQTETGDRTIFGQSYTLASGRQLKGNLAVFGGSATLEERSEVAGDIVIAGGDVDVAGKVKGDIAIMGGSVTLRATAYVDGSVSVLGGSIQRDAGATVTGQVVSGLTLGQTGAFSIPSLPEAPRAPQAPRLDARVDGPNLLVRLFLRLLGAFLLAALLAALTLIVLSFAPQASRRVSDAALSAPAVALILGLMTTLLAASVALLMAITICLMPVAFLLLITLALASLFGWIVVGWIVGERLLLTLKVTTPNALIAGVIGVALITLIARLPCVGFVLFILGASIGLGAVVMTRAGRQVYPSPQSRP
jgi:hypothetical protein